MDSLANPGLTEPAARERSCPMQLSTLCHSLDRARYFYGDVLGCEEQRHTPTSVHLAFFGHQLTLHCNPEYNAVSTHLEVDAEDVPVPHFGAALKGAEFQRIAKRLREANWPFVIEPQPRDLDNEQEMLCVLDPSGNAIVLQGAIGARI